MAENYDRGDDTGERKHQPMQGDVRVEQRRKDDVLVVGRALAGGRGEAVVDLQDDEEGHTGGNGLAYERAGLPRYEPGGREHPGGDDAEVECDRPPEHVRHQEPVSDQEEIIDHRRDENAGRQPLAAAGTRIRLELLLDRGREGDAALPPDGHEGFDRFEGDGIVRHRPEYRAAGFPKSFRARLSVHESNDLSGLAPAANPPATS
jgi:hypothetical protein